MQVFISHASTDEALARKVAAALKKDGLDAWDGTDILPGENWAAKVSEALQHSDAMIVLLTPDALRSHHVSHEISFALGDQHYSRRIVPVLTVSPEQLPKEKIPWILNTFSIVSLLPHEQNENGFRRLAQVIKESNLVPS